MRFMESAILNGANHEMLAKLFNVGVQSLKWNLNRNAIAKRRYEIAVEQVTGRATASLIKLAEGFTAVERTYHLGFDGEINPLDADELKKLIDKKDWESFWTKIRSLAGGEKQYIREVEKYYPPDRLSAQKILEAHKEEVWDIEARRKKIPDVKIEVKLDDGGKKLKRIDPDLIIEAKEVKYIES
jgi:hypothetical protein